MVVFGTLKNENAGSQLFNGDIQSCKEFCKKLVPADYEAVNICEDNGIISKRIIYNGVPAENFKELIEDN